MLGKKIKIRRALVKARLSMLQTKLIFLAWTWLRTCARVMTQDPIYNHQVKCS